MLLSIYITLTADTLVVNKGAGVQLQEERQADLERVHTGTSNRNAKNAAKTITSLRARLDQSDGEKDFEDNYKRSKTISESEAPTDILNTKRAFRNTSKVGSLVISENSKEMPTTTRTFTLSRLPNAAPSRSIGTAHGPNSERSTPRGGRESRNGPRASHVSDENSASCESWCTRGNKAPPPYFLTAVLLVRIYSWDLAQLTTRELVQWIQYLRYAGVEHIYVYDAYVHKNESQQQALSSLVSKGFVTYVDWHKHAYPYTIKGTQVTAYQDCIDRWGNDTLWQMATDMDEYPFSSVDTKPNFMQHFVRNFSKMNPRVNEIHMANYLFLGTPLNDSDHPLLIDRFWRRTPNPGNPLMKPIYKPASVKTADVHRNIIPRGTSMYAPHHLLRMNHYWGARLQKWGEDANKILARTIPDGTMQPIIDQLKECAWCIDKYSLYTKRLN